MILRNDLRQAIDYVRVASEEGRDVDVAARLATYVLVAKSGGAPCPRGVEACARALGVMAGVEQVSSKGLRTLRQALEEK